MNLIFKYELLEPPSSIICFRDVTLQLYPYFDAILIEVPENLQDPVWRWIKLYGARDYVNDLVGEGKESGVLVGSPRADFELERIVAENVIMTCNRLRLYSIHG